VNRSFKIRIAALAAMLTFAICSVAQIQLGDVTMNANGTLSMGYSGNYGEQTDSSHSLTGGGSGSLNGYYFNPRFLSFDLQPYYNQSRANSASSSVTDSTGVTLSTSIFSGSRFPGSFSYSRGYNSSGTFGVLGAADLTTHGNTQSFTVGWGANLPGLPSISAQFQDTSSGYSIFGTDADGTTNAKTFMLRATDRRAGFSLSGGYSHSVSAGETPLLFSNGGTAGSDNTSNNWIFSVGHSLPLNGGFSASVNRSSYNFSSTNGSGGTQAVDNFVANASIHPVTKLSFSGTATYDDNLGGTITQAILLAGATVQQVQAQPTSNALTLEGNGTYSATENLSFSGDIERRQQNWSNASFGANSIRASARYAHILFGGSFGAFSSVSENTQDNTDGYTLGFADSLSFSRAIRGWNVSFNGSYAQNQETLLISYTTSNYGLSGSVSRHITRLLSWSGSAGTSRTALTTVGGTTSSSDGFSTSLNARRWFALSGNYQRSSGTGLQTASGVTTNTPVPTPILAQQLIVLFGGHSYSFGASTSAIPHLTASASLSKSFSDTTSQNIFSTNHFDQLVVSTQYQFRKMNFIGGYSRFLQSVSVAGLPASRLCSFYFGVNRWFNFF
jgi:hypothetical protein